jgi:hypothetical protein
MISNKTKITILGMEKPYGETPIERKKKKMGTAFAL